MTRAHARISPPALRPGGTIGIFAPSSDEAGRFPSRADRAARFLRAEGFRVKAAPNAFATGLFTAGPARQRVEDLHSLWADPEVDVVLATVGGNNTNELLDLVDYDFIASCPKILVGYSDTTALLTAVWSRTGLTTFMGPQLMPQFGEVGGCLPYTLASFRKVLGEARPAGPIAPSTQWTDVRGDWSGPDDEPRGLVATSGPRVVKPGAATGPVFAANLDTLLRLAGTRYWPDLKGHVVLLESGDSSPSRLAAQLTQLRHAGVLAGAVGLGLGRFPAAGESSALLADTLRDAFRDFPGPVVADLDIGHTDPMICVPNGIAVSLEASEGSADSPDSPHALLSFEEPAVIPHHRSHS
ncbi:S66 peptidase family protein [Streptomyces sp. NPDC048623]|uniref:S66 family peptidase n=1 Tax=Streptomyces sp. NPDC048623 TaxID=3155761 RepID=UPI0034263380